MSRKDIRLGDIEKVSFPRKCICAVVVNDKGDILPYTCASSKESCEEHCEEYLFKGCWKTMKDLGAKVVQAEIIVLEDIDD